jgi:eukaryotic-like serine/threonine-protein kinase
MSDRLIGQTLAHYKLTAAIGAGGMGEVYRATDTKLGRDVALKLLPAAFAAEPGRLARFEREAKVLASLNHPHIAHVYGFESTAPEAGASVHFLAMELVEGDDLAERLKRGPIPVDEVIPLARQFAEGLEAAHEKGIVHRDLKPANIKLAPDGTVKILDFGLAKAWEGDSAAGSSADLSQSPTLARTGTSAGLILGTAAYMSPEQARGKAVDKRADVWAFGVVLFEMLAGRKLFDGETVTDVLAAVVKEPINWTVLPPATPASLRRLLGRCLERDPRLRLRDIGEARITLTQPAGPPADAAPPASRPRWPMVLALVVVTAAAAAAAGWLGRGSSPPRQVRKLDIAAEGLSADERQRASLSPDGRRVAYFTGGGLHVRDLDRAEGRELPGTAGARYAFWAPDGRALGFFREETIFRVALDAPAPVIVARTGIHVAGTGACWTPGGRILFSRGNTGLFEVRAEGGEPRVLLEPDRRAGENHFHGCTVLPEDRGVLYVVHPTDSPANTIALLADGRSRTVLALPGESVADTSWSLTGHVVFERTGGARDGIWALPFSLERLEPTGEPFQVVAAAGAPSVAADGSLLYTPGQASRAQSVGWVSREGRIEETAAELPDEIGGLALSRDGKRIAVTVADGGRRNVWTIDVGRGTRTKLTPDLGIAGRPAFSADGAQVAFAVNNKVFVVPADGSATPRAVGTGLNPVFTADGRALAVHQPNAEGRFEIALLDASGGSELRTVLRDTASVRYPAFSPDGRFLSYLLGDGEAVGNIATGEMMMTRFPGTLARWQISTRGGDFGTWAPDGRRFYYITRGEGGLTRLLMEVDVRTSPDVALGVPRPLFDLAAVGVGNLFAVAPGGRRFLMVREKGDRTIARLVLVENWFAEFR